MLETTVGQLLLNDALPESMRDYNRVLDKPGVEALFNRIIEEQPDKFKDIALKLMHIGRDVYPTVGAHSIGLADLQTADYAKNAIPRIDKEVDKILDTESDPAKRREKIVAYLRGEQAKMVQSVYDESTQHDNPLARQVRYAGRGNPSQLNSLRGADLLYSGHDHKPLPIPILRNYAAGLTPAEYLAAAFGARSGVLDVKLATADAGFLSKQLNQINHRGVITADDDDTPYDEANPRGFPVDPADKGSVGALLAHPAAGYPRNTELTPKVLADIRQAGVNKILVRSPIVGGPEDGGIFARDAGRRQHGNLPAVGDFIGMSAAQALGEPISQGMLSSKHTGGVAGATAGSVAGFDAINAAIQSPETYPSGAVHAQVDGRVSAITPAPQGGHYATIGGEQHYIPADRKLSAAVGDTVEAGDAISDGELIPAELVRHKGIGAARAYFVQKFGNILKNSGISAERRNIEILAKNLINHVRLTEEHGDNVPDDVVHYQTFERRYTPRNGFEELSPAAAKGKYLERPVLHYTIGTHIKPTVAAELEQFGVQKVVAHKDPPIFEPVFVRGMAAASSDPDWMTRMIGSYQQRSLLNATHRGAVSDELGTSFVPNLARGEDFGQVGKTKSWTPKL